MNILKIILLTSLLFSINACSNTKNEDRKSQGNKMNYNILMEKPNYYLEVRGKNTLIGVYFNGINIFKHYNFGNAYTYYPINTSVTSGKNEIKVILPAIKKQDYQLNKNTEVEVNLIVKSFETGEKKTISTFKYNHNNEDVKQRFEGTSLRGKYDSCNNFEVSKDGNVEISDVKMENYETRLGKKIGGLVFTQNIYFDTSYPRWKFLDSEDIVPNEVDSYTQDELKEMKNTPEIKELYNIYTKIYEALRDKKIEDIIDLFDERNKEMDIAYDFKQNHTKDKLTKVFKEVSEDPNYKIIEFFHKKRAFYIEDNKKIIYLKAIVFNKVGGGSRKFGIKFRRENGKWILTR